MATQPDDSEGRPLAGDRPRNADYNGSTSVARCEACNHPIWSDLSVMLGIGAECRRRAA